MNMENSPRTSPHANAAAVTLLVDVTGRETWISWLPNEVETGTAITALLRQAHDDGRLDSEVFGPFVLAD